MGKLRDYAITCHDCKAGTEVSTDWVTGRTVFRDVPCTCVSKAVAPMIPEAITNECQCGAPIHYNSKRCPTCAKAHKLGIDQHRNRTSERKRRAA